MCAHVSPMTLIYISRSLKVIQGQMAKNDFHAILNVSVTLKDINLKLSMVFSPYVACKEDLDYLLSV